MGGFCNVITFNDCWLVCITAEWILAFVGVMSMFIICVTFDQIIVQIYNHRSCISFTKKIIIGLDKTKQADVSEW